LVNKKNLYSKSKKIYKSNTITAKIDKLIYGGNGITTFDGIKVFVPYTAPGDYAQLKIIEKKSKYYVAAVNKLIKPSPVRVKPLCPYFTHCGGCDLQHIDYNAQLEIKQNFAFESLNRIGHINLKLLPPIIPSQPFHYRNKTQYPLVGYPLKIGFFRQLSHHVIDIEKCLLHPSIFDRLRAFIKEQLVKAKEPIYNEIRHTGNLRNIIIRQGMHTSQILITFVTRTSHLNQQLFKPLPRVFPNIVGINQNINPYRTNRILGNKNRILLGNDYYYEKLLDKQFKVSSNAFFQVNTQQAENMVKKLREYIYPAEQVLDLYCGVGMLAIMIGDVVKKVYGVEISQDAIQDANENLRINKIKNIDFTSASVETVIQNYKAIDTVILDPPRKGCSENLLNNIIKLKPKKIIYISCNPTTFARDLGLLKLRGFHLEKYELIDMFAQTYHVESIAKIIAQ
jgi:23S rRNA (uracil1939-C5)-methyltransferase